ncbi:aminoacyl-tRNA hydrolase [soil metagenome]
MKLIVGLGNPGRQYERTRHNAGFLAIDRIARGGSGGAKGASAAGGGAGGVRQRFGGEIVEINLAGDRALLLKPMRFMNCSGSSVAEALGFYKLDVARDLLVLVDDYALPLGAIRIRAEGSSGGHNGLSDIQRALGTAAYPRLRIGIDPPPPGYGDPADWVLGQLTDGDVKALEPALDKVAQAVAVFAQSGVTAAMNRFNVKPGGAAAGLAAGTAGPSTAGGSAPAGAAATGGGATGKTAGGGRTTASTGGLGGGGPPGA